MKRPSLTISKLDNPQHRKETAATMTMIDTSSSPMIRGKKQMMVHRGCQGTTIMRAAASGRIGGGGSRSRHSYHDRHQSSSIMIQKPCNNEKNSTLAHWCHDEQEEVVLLAPCLPQQRKVVSFAPTCKVRFGVARADYTDEEISASWYSDEDLTERRRRTMDIIFKLRQGEGDRYCVRGLESTMPEAATELAFTRRMACHTVLREQENQRLTQVYDPEAIARKYRNVSARVCQLAAYHIGHEDALEAINLQGNEGMEANA